MTASITSYVNRIEQVFQQSLKAWKKYQDILTENDKKYNETDWTLYTQEGKEKARLDKMAKTEQIYKEIDKVRADFQDKVKAIIKESDALFDPYFEYNPSKVDPNGLAILQNGGLEIPELINLAESYRTKGNLTMYYMCAEKLKQSKTSDRMNLDELKAKAYYEKAKKDRQTRADHQIYESFLGFCMASLRDDKILSDGITARHDEFYQEHLNASKEVIAKIENPWE